MTKAPPIPKEQRTFEGGAASRLDSARPDRRDLDDGGSTAQQDADADHRDIHRHVTPPPRSQDR